MEIYPKRDKEDKEDKKEKKEVIKKMLSKNKEKIDSIKKK